MSLLVLAAALALLRIGAAYDLRHPIIPAIAVWVAAIAGMDLPDLDFLLPFGHRSALTHSLLPALLLLPWRWARPAAAGLAIGIGLHLSADSFPQAMTGYATVKMPGGSSIGAAASYVWLGLNALAAIVLGAGWVARALGGRLVAGGLVAVLVATGFLYLLRVDGGWLALLAYTAMGLIGYRLMGSGRAPTGEGALE